MSKHIPYFYRRSKKISKLSPFASWSGAMINPQWLELRVSKTTMQQSPLVLTVLWFIGTQSGRHLVAPKIDHGIVHGHSLPSAENFSNWSDSLKRPANTRKRFALLNDVQFNNGWCFDNLATMATTAIMCFKSALIYHNLEFLWVFN